MIISYLGKSGFIVGLRIPLMFFDLIKKEASVGFLEFAGLRGVIE
jgi:hypothetical protein